MKILFFILALCNFLSAQVSQKELNTRAIDNFQREKYDSALYYFDQLILNFPKDKMAYLDRALTKEMLNDYTGAIADYSRLARIDSSEVDAFFLRGTAFYHLGFMDAALVDFNRFIASENDNAYAYYFMGKISLKSNQKKNAKKYFEKAIFYNPSHSESYYELAKFQLKHKNYDSALTLLNKSIEAFPSSEAYNLKCVISFKLNDFSSAALSFEQLSKLKPTELSEVVRICSRMKKSKQINRYFLIKNESTLNHGIMLTTYLLNGNFLEVKNQFASLPNDQKDIDFYSFLHQLAYQFEPREVK